MPNQYTVQSFAEATRQKFPGSYDDLDDRSVTNIILSQYPEYRSWITDYDKSPKVEEDYNPDLVDYAKNLIFTGVNIGTQIPSAVTGVMSKGLEFAEDFSTGKYLPAIGETAKEKKAKIQESYNKVKEASSKGVNPLTGERLPWYDRFLSDTMLGVSEDLRKWADGYMDQWIDESPDLQAYMAYNQTEEGEFSWENVLKNPFHLAMRGFTELAPTVAATITAGVYGGPGAAIAVGGLMEGSGAYNEGMRYMIDELGLDTETASSIATATSLAYGSIAGVIEKFQAGKVARQLGIGDEIMEESFSKALYKKILDYAGKEFKEENLSTSVKRVLSSADLMENMIAEGAQEMTQATLDLSIANTYKKYADKEGNISFNDMARNLADDMYEAATSEEAKDSFFSAMMGTSVPGGARRAFDYTSAKLKSDDTQLDKDKNTKYQDDTSMPYSDMPDIEDLPPVQIKDDKDLFSALTNEVLNPAKSYGRLDKYLTEDSDETTGDFLKTERTLSESLYDLFQKGLSEEIGGKPKTREDILGHLSKNQRIAAEQLIADEFMKKVDINEGISDKAKSVLEALGVDNLLDSSNANDIETIFQLMETGTAEGRKDIISELWKLASDEVVAENPDFEGLSDKEVNDLADNTEAFLAEQVDDRDIPGQEEVTKEELSTVEGVGISKQDVDNMSAEEAVGMFQSGWIAKLQDLSQFNLRNGNLIWDNSPQGKENKEKAWSIIAEEQGIAEETKKQKVSPKIKVKNEPLEKVEKWLQANKAIPWSKKETKAYKEQRKKFIKAAERIGAVVRGNMDNSKIKAAILTAAKKKYKPQATKSRTQTVTTQKAEKAPPAVSTKFVNTTPGLIEESEVYNLDEKLTHKKGYSEKLIWTPDGWGRVSGKDVKLKASKRPFFVRKAEDGSWNITDTRVGLIIGKGKTQKEAIENAENRITNAKEAGNYEKIVQEAEDKLKKLPAKQTKTNKTTKSADKIKKKDVPETTAPQTIDISKPVPGYEAQWKVLPDDIKTQLWETELQGGVEVAEQAQKKATEEATKEAEQSFADKYGNGNVIDTHVNNDIQVDINNNNQDMNNKTTNCK